MVSLEWGRVGLRRRRMKEKKIPHLVGSVQDPEILRVLAMERGSQDFGITSPSTGLICIPLGHLPNLVPTVLFTSSFSLVSFHPR